jgi:hypothetical protein
LLEDQVTASGGFSGIDVSADNEGQMNLITHVFVTCFNKLT